MKATFHSGLKTNKAILILKKASYQIGLGKQFLFGSTLGMSA